MDEDESRVCRVCGSDDEILRCGRCRRVFYCSRQHQREDWPVHQSACEDRRASIDLSRDSLAAELARTCPSEIRVAILLDEERGAEVPVAIDSPEYSTAGELIARLREELPGSIRHKKWRLERQGHPLDEDDFLGQLELLEKERLVMRAVEEAFTVTLTSRRVTELGLGDNKSVTLNGLPGDVTAKQLQTYLRERFAPDQPLVLKRPGRCLPVLRGDKPVRELMHRHSHLVVDYARWPLFAELPTWRNAGRRWLRRYGKLALLLLLLAALALMVWLAIRWAPRKKVLR